MESREAEVAFAIKSLGLNPQGPFTQEQLERIRSLVWKRRKAEEQRIRDAIKATGPVKLLGSRFLPDGVESKPEEALLMAMNLRSMLIGEFKPQFQVGPYFLDFGFPKEKLAVEIDGREYHSSPEQMHRDSKRTNYLAKLGWTVKRFSASDILRNPISCCDEIEKLASTLRKTANIKDPWE